MVGVSTPLRYSQVIPKVHFFTRGPLYFQLCFLYFFKKKITHLADVPLLPLLFVNMASTPAPTFNRHFEAGNPKSEKRLRRCIPLIVTQVDKVHKQREGRHLTDEEEDAVAAEIEVLLREGKACEKAIQRITDALCTRTSSALSQVSQISELQRLLNDDTTSSWEHSSQAHTPMPPDTLRPKPNHVRRRCAIERDIWAHLVEVSHDDYLKDEDAEKQARHDATCRQRRALDEQILEKRNLEALQRQQEEEEHVEKKQELARWKAEEAEKEQKIRAVNVQEKKERDSQLRERQRRRQKEADVRLQQEKDLYEQAMQQGREEQAQLTKKREAAILGVKRNAYYNEAQRKLKDLAVIEEQKLDARLAQQHAARLAKEEQLRESYQAEIALKQARQKEMGEAMDASLAEKAAADEQRALLVTEQVIQLQRQADAKKRAEQERQQQRTIRFLRRQIEHKEELKLREKQEALEDKQRIRESVESAAAEVQRERAERREIDKSFLTEVVKQIREKQDRIPEVCFFPLYPCIFYPINIKPSVLVCVDVEHFIPQMSSPQYSV